MSFPVPMGSKVRRRHVGFASDQHERTALDKLDSIGGPHGRRQSKDRHP
jgi:hypothetical protein